VISHGHFPTSGLGINANRKFRADWGCHGPQAMTDTEVYLKATAINQTKR
jgi:hypothetical protein